MKYAIAPGLPELCYSLNDGDRCIIIRQGEAGYHATDYPAGYTDAIIDAMNARLGVDRAQRLAMEIGSMVGWDVPGADPAAHTARLAALGLLS